LPPIDETATRAPVLLEVERFEHVRAGGERVLLRVDGRYGDRPGRRVLEACLFVDDGLAVHRHTPLPDYAPGAGDDAWLWRAAFEVPESYLTDERTRFAIEASPGSLVDLPRPGEALASSSSVALSARSARIVRRYAAAIAVVLSVAVAPGALPSQARNEVLRVHHPDGSVGYVSSDGQPLGTGCEGGPSHLDGTQAVRLGFDDGADGGGPADVGSERRHVGGDGVEVDVQPAGTLREGSRRG
jgi:hypothetical protein